MKAGASALERPRTIPGVEQRPVHPLDATAKHASCRKWPKAFFQPFGGLLSRKGRDATQNKLIPKYWNSSSPANESRPSRPIRCQAARLPAPSSRTARDALPPAPRPSADRSVRFSTRRRAPVPASPSQPSATVQTMRATSVQCHKTASFDRANPPTGRRSDIFV